MNKPDSRYLQERSAAVEAVRQAGRLCRDVQSQLGEKVLEKDDRSPVTIADFGSQALICKALREQFPNDSVMAEEDSSALTQPGGRSTLEGVVQAVRETWAEALERDVCSWIDHGNAREYEDRMWILDPIDGTKGFLRGDQFAIALALVVDGEVSLGVLGCPNLNLDGARAGAGTLFVAERDEGAWQMSMAGSSGSMEPIEVSTTSEVSQARFCESFESAHSDRTVSSEVGERLGITREPVRVDSQVKYGIVARGDVEIYLRQPRGDYIEKVWDHAAGMLVVEEAGGTITDIRGAQLEFTHGRLLSENRGIVATNGVLHDDVMEALSATIAT